MFLYLVLEWRNHIIVLCNFDIDNTKNYIIFQIVFQKTLTPCWKVFGTDDAIWYWQFNYFSKMTIVALLCRTMAINYLYFKHACMATSVSRRLNIISLKFKIRLFCMTSLLTTLYVRVDTLLAWQNTGMISSFSLRRKCLAHKPYNT